MSLNNREFLNWTLNHGNATRNLKRTATERDSA